MITPAQRHNRSDWSRVRPAQCDERGAKEPSENENADESGTAGEQDSDGDDDNSEDGNDNDDDENEANEKASS